MVQKDILFIGDTLHDKEVADKICSEILLVSNGHQVLNEKRINRNASVVNSLRDIILLDL